MGARRDYVLKGHKCRKIASLVVEPPRDWWLGELTEPIPDWPRETHCLHLKTPLKEIVLGVYSGDFEQWAVLAYIVRGEKHINQHWIERMANAFRKRAVGPHGR